MTKRNFNAQTFQINHDFFLNYLSNFNLNHFDQYKNSIEMWKDSYTNFSKENVPFTFSLLAQEIIQIPSSEAPVERVFSAPICAMLVLKL